MARMKPVPVFPKFTWDGERIHNQWVRGQMTSLFDFKTDILLTIPAVVTFLSKLHIGKFTSEKPNLLLSIEASDSWVNVYIGNNIDDSMPYAYMRLVKCKVKKRTQYATQKSKWKLYETGVYD